MASFGLQERAGVRINLRATYRAARPESRAQHASAVKPDCLSRLQIKKAANRRIGEGRTTAGKRDYIND
jgi:hypothetical protein